VSKRDQCSVALRIDDIGASSKQFEIYSKTRWANILFLKTLPRFRAWGPYREMSAAEWSDTLETLEDHNARITVAITASWVESDGTLVPFPRKWPAEARALLEGQERGLIEIANHGMTHCVVGKHRPRAFRSNRNYHREFWDWIPRETHFRHMRESQDILQQYFGARVTTFVPPGNVFTLDTVDAAREFGIERINCSGHRRKLEEMRFINNDQVVDFHDREIVLHGVGWVGNCLAGLPKDTTFSFIKDL